MSVNWKRLGLVGFLLGAILPQGAQSAGAETPTTVTIGSVSTGGTTVSVTGAVAYGDDAAAPQLVGEDAMGDDVDGGRIPQGADLGNSTIATDLTGRKLVFGFGVHDQIPGAHMSPALTYVWSFSVNGNDETKFLSSGTAGSWTGLTPIVEPTGFFRLCQSPDGYSCPTALTGSMGDGKVQINLPFSLASIKPGALIDVGAGGGCGFCTAYNPTVTLLSQPNADMGNTVGYQMPGEVKLGVAPIGTPDESVATPVTATTLMPSTKTTGTFSGVVNAPSAPGEYKVVAETCFGNVESPVCFVTSSPFTVA